MKSWCLHDDLIWLAQTKVGFVWLWKRAQPSGASAVMDDTEGPPAGACFRKQTQANPQIRVVQL